MVWASPPPAKEAIVLTTRSVRRTTIAVALAGALLAPAASADPHYLDNRGAASGATATVEPRQDLRSPDTRDAAMGRGTSSVPDVTVVKVPEPAPAAERGVDWGDAGIGAGTALGVIAVGLAGAMAVVYRRRRGPQTAPAA
jgi:hypothetical protein